MDVDEIGRHRPPAMALPGGGDKKLAVVFSRAGLWCGAAGDVLFLDRPLWNGAMKGIVRRASRESMALAENTGLIGKTRKSEPERGDMPSLQGSLFDAIDRCAAPPELVTLIAEAVYDNWLDLFELLDSRPLALSEEEVAFYHRMMRAVEFNEGGGTDANWPILLSRIQRRVALLSLLSLLPRETPSPTPSAASPSRPSPSSGPSSARFQANASEAVSFREALAQVSSGLKREVPFRRTTFKQSLTSRSSQDAKKKPTDENQRALDRLSYLGGILIPLPIIAGILSMGDTYGPEGKKFYVFWVIALPLSALTVLLIYADTIRKAEVWVEIGADRVVPSLASDSETGGGGGDGGVNGVSLSPVGVELKNSLSVSVGRRQQGQQGQQGQQDGDDREPQSPPQQDNVVFTVDHDAEERNVGIPTMTAAAAAAMQLPDGEIRGLVLDEMSPASRWSTGQIQVPLVILERPSDGRKPKAWKREQLGWTGAIRSILYKRPRAGTDIPDGVAALEKPSRRRTTSY
ncbi:hypothetical protein VTI74DRAFT_9319 [Chaetomium olivicolor]